MKGWEWGRGRKAVWKRPDGKIVVRNFRRMKTGQRILYLCFSVASKSSVIGSWIERVGLDDTLLAGTDFHPPCPLSLRVESRTEFEDRPDFVSLHPPASLCQLGSPPFVCLMRLFLTMTLLWLGLPKYIYTVIHMTGHFKLLVNLLLRSVLDKGNAVLWKILFL